MGLIDLIALIFETLKAYGAIGLLAAAGWGLTAWHIWKGNKNKIEWGLIIKAKDELIASKDSEISDGKDKLAATIVELSNQRIEDLKESSDELSELCNKTVHTLDRLTLALNVHEYTKDEPLI